MLRVGNTFLSFHISVIFLGILLAAAPVPGQQATPNAPADPPENGQPAGRTFWNSGNLSLTDYVRGRGFVRPGRAAPALSKPSQMAAPGMIGKMEAAFSCNDTPFIDQVRLPMAAFWGGRLRLTGFESDVTTANFVMGLPGAGTLHSLSLMGSGHLATHAPPSDQLVGMHLTFYLRGGETGAQENSGLRGMQYLVRSSREFFQTFAAR